MRLFLAALVIVALLALDRAYLDGQNAAILMSFARQAGAMITDWSDRLSLLQNCSVIVSGCKRERDRVTAQEAAGLGMLYAWGGGNFWASLAARSGFPVSG